MREWNPCLWFGGCPYTRYLWLLQIARLQARIDVLESQKESSDDTRRYNQGEEEFRGDYRNRYVAQPLPRHVTLEEEDVVCIKRSDLELLYLKERAIDAIQEGITIADATLPDMPLIYINEGFSKMTGYSTQFAKNQNCRFLQGEGTDPESVRQLKISIKKGEPCVSQITNYKKDGTPFINYLSLTPISDKEGTLTHYVGIQSDITELVERKQAEIIAKNEASQAAAATEAKSEFLARMSHEIRTPLNGMIAVGQLLADTNLTPQQWDLVNTIQCSGEALLSLITDILDFSKIEANKMELMSTSFYLISTVEAAMEIAGMQAAQKRLHLAYSIRDDVPEILHGDPYRLQQILLNILNNAVKFTDEGQVFLEISSQPFEEDKDTMEQAYKENETCIHFRVSDTGIGIPEGDIKRLFRSFSQLDTTSTRKFGGSGLGLIISQKLCEAMGGHMWARSDGFGKGSTFRWYIKSPKNVHYGSLPACPYKTDSLDISGKRILLLEESDMVRTVVEDTLIHWGCSVYSTAQEEDAIKSLVLNTDTEIAEGSTCKGPFDVIILSVGHKALVSKLINHRHSQEADRCIFLTWPGHVNLSEIHIQDDETPKNSIPEIASINQSNIGYVTVSRPVRQGRLQIALKEVLDLDIHTCSSGMKTATEQERYDQGSKLSDIDSDMLMQSQSSGSLLQAPLRKGASQTSTELVDSDPDKNSGKRLLIVEDNIINMKVAIGILKKLGFSDIDTARDGLEALAKIKEAGGPQSYFSILMDLHMPHLDGVGCVKEINSLYPSHSTKIIAVTADAFEETRDMCIANGFRGWLAKPFRVEEFARIMSHDK